MKGGKPGYVPNFSSVRIYLENGPFLPYVGPRCCHISRFNSPPKGGLEQAPPPDRPQLVGPLQGTFSPQTTHFSHMCTPLSPISQNCILFFGAESFISPPRQPISPICRTPLSPHISEFDSFFGAESLIPQTTHFSHMSHTPFPPYLRILFLEQSL